MEIESSYGRDFISLSVEKTMTKDWYESWKTLAPRCRSSLSRDLGTHWLCLRLPHCYRLPRALPVSLHKWFDPSLGSQPARRAAIPTFAAFAVSRFVIAGLLDFVKNGFFSNLIVGRIVVFSGKGLREGNLCVD